jgi:hypothetical protein
MSDSLTKLDTAYCSHSERISLLESSYHLQGLSVDCSDIFPHSNEEKIKELIKKATDWIINKQIRLSKLIISQRWMHSSKVLFGVNNEAIVAIHFSDCLSSNMSNLALQFLNNAVVFINSCRSLKSLKFDEWKDTRFVLLNIDDLILKQLMVFNWTVTESSTDDLIIVDILRTNCSQLTELQLVMLQFNFSSVPENSLLQLITNNIKLKLLVLIDFSVSDHLLNGLKLHNNCLESVMVIRHPDDHQISFIGLHSINMLLTRAIKTNNSLWIMIDGQEYGRRERHDKLYMFGTQFVTETVYHDLLLLAESPIARDLEINDYRLCFNDQQFIMFDIY